MASWNKIEFTFAFKLHISPRELESLEFYRIQYILMELEEYIDRENKEHAKQKQEIEKQQKSATPSSPGHGKIQVPKFDIPKFKV